MTERIRPRRHDDATFGPGNQNNIFVGADDFEGTVMVSHGPYMERLPVGNMTVRDIRMRFGDRLDIDPRSQAVVDGQEVDESTCVTTGQVLTFVRKAGEKGNLA
jgi:hypothetical protein